MRIVQDVRSTGLQNATRKAAVDRPWAILIAAILVLIVPRAAYGAADSDFWKEDRFKIKLGGFFSFLDTDVRVNGRGGLVGTGIDLESDLNLDEFQILPFVDLGWNITRRQRLELSYFALRRSAERDLSAEINFGDETFLVGTRVDSDFALDVLLFSYIFSFIHDDKKEFGVVVGLHGTHMRLELESTGGLLGEVEEFGFPLPVVGFQGGYNITPKWTVAGRVQYFQVKIDDYDGRLITAAVDLERKVSKHMSVGVGYRYFNLNIDSEDTFFTGNFEFTYQGPAIYAGFNF